MRIIAQDGTDLPYDKIIVAPCGEKIKARIIGGEFWVETLGTYESPEQAKQVMAEIREQWKKSELYAKNTVYEMPPK